MPENLTQDLLELLGEENFIRLIKNYSGEGCYIAGDVKKSDMTAVLGEEIMKVLSYYYGGTPLKVPIGRAYLAKHYRLQGLSNREIARQLKVTESTVYRLFKRQPVGKPSAKRLVTARKHGGLDAAPAQKKPRRDPRQMEMFG